MMLVKSSITACGSSEYSGVCCCQFRRSVVVKGWYRYCMGRATYDPSAWGNGGSGAWFGWHSAAARGHENSQSGGRAARMQQES
jgi:hypothetical protein